jgi:hypothetical protein
MTAALCAAVLLAILTTTYIACCFSCTQADRQEVHRAGAQAADRRSRRSEDVASRGQWVEQAGQLVAHAG